MDGVLEAVGFIGEEFCLTHSCGKGVTADGTNSLKGGLLEGVLE